MQKLCITDSIECRHPAFSRFDRTPTCDGQTDGKMDGRTDTRLHHILR